MRTQASEQERTRVRTGMIVQEFIPNKRIPCKRKRIPKVGSMIRRVCEDA